MVNVGSSHLPVDSQPKSVGLVLRLAATRRSVCIHHMNRANSRNSFGYDDSTINIIVLLSLLTCCSTVSRRYQHDYVIHRATVT